MSSPSRSESRPVSHSPEIDASVRDAIEDFARHSRKNSEAIDVLVVTDEVYPMPWSTGCPYGWMRTVDISDPAAPTVLGAVKLDENSCDFDEADATYTAHNATATHDLALVSWHSAGLQAIDLSDPANPTRLGELRPEPLPSVDVEDPGLGGNPITMWSYPVIQDGLIYVIDIRNGLYILRYHGPFEDEITEVGFAAIL